MVFVFFASFWLSFPEGFLGFLVFSICFFVDGFFLRCSLVFFSFFGVPGVLDIPVYFVLKCSDF